MVWALYLMDVPEVCRGINLPGRVVPAYVFTVRSAAAIVVQKPAPFRAVLQQTPHLGHPRKSL